VDRAIAEELEDVEMVHAVASGATIRGFVKRAALLKSARSGALWALSPWLAPR
jgi:hypothetical protein